MQRLHLSIGCTHHQAALIIDILDMSKITLIAPQHKYILADHIGS